MVSMHIFSSVYYLNYCFCFSFSIQLPFPFMFPLNLDTCYSSYVTLIFHSTYSNEFHPSRPLHLCHLYIYLCPLHKLRIIFSSLSLSHDHLVATASCLILSLSALSLTFFLSLQQLISASDECKLTR